MPASNDTMLGRKLGLALWLISGGNEGCSEHAMSAAPFPAMGALVLLTTMRSLTCCWPWARGTMRTAARQGRCFSRAARRGDRPSLRSVAERSIWLQSSSPRLQA